jgi:propionyl-CoA carboxylase alpha chain
MFKKILIANRGEIAVRIIRTCKKMGIQTVAVYSEADARSLHVIKADESFLIGGSLSTESYLNIQKIIDVALTSNCQAIHPGYGFLSENAEFCKQVSDNGLVFIGPDASAIAAMGDKIMSKKLAIKAGVPTVPGHTELISNPDEARKIAGSIGYPVLLKPSAGGGGKGMRIIHDENEIEHAFLTCQKETMKAFGDDSIFMERYIKSPRHIEMQILGDHYGNFIYLAERECSIQRRYQKIIEESPSVAVDELIRKEMGELACNLAKQSGYTNAGTVEFIMDTDKKFYFLEMNTRLQVEHPVTEMVTGLDLVELQINIASKKPLGLKQKDVQINGWSIEARICAEDVSRGFMPATGIVTRYAEPKGNGVRVDSGIQAGSTVGVYYDPMLAKVICHGTSRQDTISKITEALNGYHIEGVATNVDFVNAIINHPVFIRGDISTDFLSTYMEDNKLKTEEPQEHLNHAVLAATLVYHNRQTLVRASLKPMIAQVGSGRKLKDDYAYMVKSENDIFDIKLKGNQYTKNWVIVVNNKEYNVVTPEFEFYRRRLKLEINGTIHMFRIQYSDNFIWAAYCGITRTYEIYTPREWDLVRFMPKPREKVAENTLLSPMPGIIVSVLTQPGDRVHRGQELVVMESMKMESGVACTFDAKVAKVHVKPGQTVETGDVLVTFS